MTRDDAISVVKKLKALAEKSEGGERSSAMEKLKSFCFKHDLDADDYSVETVHASISYQSEQERVILSNVLCMVMGVDQVKGTIKNGAYHFQCSARELENIRDAFAYYKKLYYEYADILVVALVSRNEVGNKKKASKEFKFDDDPTSSMEEEIVEKKDEIPPPTSRSPSPEEVKKNDLTMKLCMIVEPKPWNPKIKPKFLLT